MELPEPIKRAIFDGEPWKEWPEIFVRSISTGERERGKREKLFHAWPGVPFVQHVPQWFLRREDLVRLAARGVEGFEHERLT
eukprot:915979-Pleurochrysis_carterae.AAC.1